MSRAGFIAGLTVLGLAAVACAVSPADPKLFICQQWPYLQEVSAPAKPAEGEQAKWYRFVVTPTVFGGAREDLGDLRLYDDKGVEVPYALRVRNPHDSTAEVTARSFNRSVAKDETAEVTLDLGDDPPEHNEVDVQMPGANYRRPTRLDGSDDNQTWKKMAEKNLVSYASDGNKLEDLRLTYPPSRYRYLRLHVKRDEAVDEKPVDVGAVQVRRKIVVPGEYVTHSAKVGPRDATRSNGSPGSAWIVELEAAHSPCEQLLVDIGDAEFNRDYTIERALPGGIGETFQWVANGNWKRTAGDPRKPMEAKFSEVQTGRLRIVITDFSNPSLNVHGAQYVAPAREIVFENKSTLEWPLRLYYGNLEADAPHYDLERNLPEQLAKPPAQASLAERQPNPAYVPKPLPLSQRWPWAIYVVLGAACAVLALILFNLGRKAVALHDAAEAKS
jgi:hypothetical protein